MKRSTRVYGFTLRLVSRGQLVFWSSEDDLQAIFEEKLRDLRWLCHAHARDSFCSDECEDSGLEL